MAKIYRTTDRLEVQIDDITVKIAPLNRQQKSEVQALMLEGQKTSDIQKLNEALVLAVKMSLKDIKGVQDSEGEEYKLEFDGGLVSDASINDLMNMENSQTLLNVCATFVAGIPKTFTLEGVSFVTSTKK